MLSEHKAIHGLFTAFLSWGMLASFAPADSAYSATPAEDDPLAFYTPDAHFKATTLPDWVWNRPLQGYADNEAHIEAAAKAGVQIIYSSSAAVYYPLKRNDPKSGLTPEQETALKGQVARANSHDMKIVIAGQASVTNLSHLIRLHPEWAMHPTDDPAFEEKPQAGSPPGHTRILP